MEKEARALAQAFSQRQNRAERVHTYIIDGANGEKIVVTVGLVSELYINEAIKAIRDDYSIRSAPRAAAGSPCPACGGTGRINR